MNGKIVNIQYSQTVTHEAPFTGDINEYTIGDPVFCTCRVCKYVPVKDSEDNIIGGEGSYTTSAMDCICELKPEGTVILNQYYLQLTVIFTLMYKILQSTRQVIRALLCARGGSICGTIRKQVPNVFLRTGC